MALSRLSRSHGRSGSARSLEESDALQFEGSCPNGQTPHLRRCVATKMLPSLRYPPTHPCWSNVIPRIVALQMR